MAGNDYWHCLKCNCKLVYDPDEKWSDGRLYCEKCYDKLEAENVELRERIELAISYLPECPNKAKDFLTLSAE